MSSSVNPLSSIGTALSSSGSGTGSSSTTGTGLGAGIDVQQFVQYAVANQQATITNLQNQQSSLASQNSEISNIQSQLTALDNAANALSDPLGAFNAQVATPSDPSILSATTNGSAAAGTHTISVTNLATTSSWYTDEVANGNAALDTGDTFVINVGGKQVASITTSSSDNTLNSLAAAINKAQSSVTATVISDDGGSRLALVSNSSGTAGNITVSGSLHIANTATGTSGDTAVNFNQGTPGNDAHLYVDGVPYASSTNIVTGALAGIALNLSQPTTVNGVDTPISLSVSQDTSQVTTAINNLVSDYNTVTNEINNQFAVSSDGTANGVLENDDTLRQVQSMLLSAITYSLPSTSSNTVNGVTNSGYTNLASIGVNMNDDGTLTVDNSALSNALSTNLPAVQNLLQNATNGFAQNLDTVLQSVNAPSTGMLSVDSAGNTSTSNDLTSQISDLQAALTAQEQELTTVYAKVNTTLQELPLLENQTNQQLSGIA